ncbi:MAG: hypothetical protein FWG63_00485 [Defluviitaleaceae bacterium]|nr:hypothetical protein [Defluviitaleaceae bacterium]
MPKKSKQRRKLKENPNLFWFAYYLEDFWKPALVGITILVIALFAPNILPRSILNFLISFVPGLSVFIFIAIGGLALAILRFILDPVYVTKNNPTIYHYRKNCGNSGANRPRIRFLARREGLEPCARCHKVKK